MKLRELSVSYAAFGFLLLASTAYGSHGQATVSDIDFTGEGVFNGSYLHAPGSGADHPWFVVDAVAGDILTAHVQGFTNGSSYGWWYQEIDNQIVEVGDSPLGGSPELLLLAQGDDDPSFDVGLAESEGEMEWSLSTGPVPVTGQYAFQLDSWLGSSGEFTVTISIPEPGTLSLLGLGALLLPGCRRQRS